MTQEEGAVLIDRLTEDEHGLLFSLLVQKYCTRADRTLKLASRVMQANPSATWRLLETLRIWNKEAEKLDATSDNEEDEEE